MSLISFGRAARAARQPVVAAALVFGGLDATRLPGVPQPALVEIKHLQPHEVRQQGFTLSTDQVVQVRAVGAGAPWERHTTWLRTSLVRGRNDRGDREPEPWAGNAWILDLRTRKLVWELRDASPSRGSSRQREFVGPLRLPAGAYAAFYAAFPPVDYRMNKGETTRISVNREWRDALDAFSLTISGNGATLPASEVTRISDQHRAGAFVTLAGSGPQQFKQAGFTLDRPVEVEIQAVGEAREDGDFDSGWIIDADTRQKVWKLTWRDSTPAGGAAKNRIARTTRTLPRGRYAAFYATDDSHDPTSWNAPPPHDPAAWGLVIRTVDASAVSAVKAFAYEHVPSSATIVALTRIGDEDLQSKGFTLTRRMDVRIYALGEGRDGRMFDYAWITGGASRRGHVWQMRYQDTSAAGGDTKNRLTDTVIPLDPGDYVVHYVSDDSHSYALWNASAPPDVDHWGITVLAASGTLDRGAVGTYVEKADPSVIAEIVRVRHDDRARKPFTLTRDSNVRIVALGESTGGEMADYGWIEEAKTGRRVWEMTYRTTDHAGGATKNRVFEGTIKLPAGDYILMYRTDDSHAFGDWNAAPPDEPESWGISLYRTP